MNTSPEGPLMLLLQVLLLLLLLLQILLEGGINSVAAVPLQTT